MFSSRPFVLTTVLVISLALCRGATAVLNLRTVYEFPNGTWVENIAVRVNGKLLVTLVNLPELWEINPFIPPSNRSARLVHTFTNATYLTGITEVGTDVFAVVASNTVWTVDVSDDRNVEVADVVYVPGGLLNGLTTLNAEKGVVISADSSLGLIWRVDIADGTYEVVLQDATMTPVLLGRMPIGVNGVKVLDGFVYYDNSGEQLFCRVEVDLDSGKATGPYEVIVKDVLADDFAINSAGAAYLAGSSENVVTRVWPNGTTEVVAGNLNSSAVAGATSAAFGRTKWDSHVLYVTTEGGLGGPVNGTYVEGGKVVALYT